MKKFLKILGIAALVSVPVYLIIKKLRTDKTEDASEDDWDIYAEEQNAEANSSIKS